MVLVGVTGNCLSLCRHSLLASLAFATQFHWYWHHDKDTPDEENKQLLPQVGKRLKVSLFSRWPCCSTRLTIVLRNVFISFSFCFFALQYFSSGSFCCYPWWRWPFKLYKYTIQIGNNCIRELNWVQGWKSIVLSRLRIQFQSYTSCY